jgi:hypothetical protein
MEAFGLFVSLGLSAFALIGVFVFKGEIVNCSNCDCWKNSKKGEFHEN